MNISNDKDENIRGNEYNFMNDKNDAVIYEDKGYILISDEDKGNQ